MTAHCSRAISHSYYVVMIDYPAHSDKYGPIRPACQEAVANPEITRREVVARIKSGEYQNIAFIHHIDGLSVEDVTLELTEEADDIGIEQFERAEALGLADRFDHARALRNETAQ